MEKFSHESSERARHSRHVTVLQLVYGVAHDPFEAEWRLNGIEVGILTQAKSALSAFGLGFAASWAAGSDRGELTAAGIANEITLGAAPDTPTRKEKVEESATPRIRHFTLRQPAGTHPGG
jgi:hypothetical protein